jgi:hypothetical protein
MRGLPTLSMTLNNSFNLPLIRRASKINGAESYGAGEYKLFILVGRRPPCSWWEDPEEAYLSQDRSVDYELGLSLKIQLERFLSFLSGCESHGFCVLDTERIAFVIAAFHAGSAAPRKNKCTTPSHPPAWLQTEQNLPPGRTPIHAE